jgi:hypothetical protein
LETPKPLLGPKSQEILSQKKDPISLVDLSELSGFPIESIKLELGLDDDDISLEELRKKMLTFLDSTMKNSN